MNRSNKALLKAKRKARRNNQIAHEETAPIIRCYNCGMKLKKAFDHWFRCPA
jgi:hypothetical protein